jgi:phage shock protein A
MSLLGKMFHSLTGSANDALDAHQNLGANARQSVRELDAQLQEADSALINVRAEAEILKGKKENAEAEVAKWLKAATNAAGKDDSLAKECLVKKSSASSALDVIIYSINKFQPTVTALETRIDQLRSQRDGLSNQADLISVRSEVADVEMKAATILGATGVSTSLASQEDALTRKEARAHAATSLVADRSGESLEARVAALTTGPSIDDELAALKAGK